MVSNNLKKVHDELQNTEYDTLYLKKSSINGMINVDISNLSKSVPEGEDTGPFATLDDPKGAIPEEVVNIVEENNCKINVLGHGTNRLHVRITEN